MVTKTLKFLPIATDDLVINTILDFDIFIKTVNDNIILFRSKNLPFTEKTLHNLTTNNVKRLFISEEDKDKIENYLQTLRSNNSTTISCDGFAAPFDIPENVEKYYKTYFILISKWFSAIIQKQFCPSITATKFWFFIKPKTKPVLV